MKYLLILLLGFAATVSAETTPRMIEVTGSSEILVAPDQAFITMAVKTRSKNMQEAQSKNNETLDKLLDYLLNELKIPTINVQTNLFTLTPEYVRCYDSKMANDTCDPSKIAYYNIEKGIAIKLNNLKDYERVISKAIELGVTNINPAEFTTTDLRKYKDQARLQAISAAKEKATMSANALGMTLNKPITINVDSSNSSYQLYQNNVSLMGADSSSEGGNFGQISISARVSITFEMQ